MFKLYNSFLTSPSSCPSCSLHYFKCELNMLVSSLKKWSFFEMPFSMLRFFKSLAALDFIHIYCMLRVLISLFDKNSSICILNFFVGADSHARGLRNPGELAWPC